MSGWTSTRAGQGLNHDFERLRGFQRERRARDFRTILLLQNTDEVKLGRYGARGKIETEGVTAIADPCLLEIRAMFVGDDAPDLHAVVDDLQTHSSIGMRSDPAPSLTVAGDWQPQYFQ